MRSWLMAVACVGMVAGLAFVPVAEAQSDHVSDGDARALFTEARAAYDAARFEEAARAFRRAYLLSPRFALLYNIGQSELRAGHDALALEAFEGFLRQAPQDHANRSEVEERARVLRSMGVTAATTAAAQVTPPPTPVPTPTPPVVTATATPQPAATPTAAATTLVTPPAAIEPTQATPVLQLRDQGTDDGPGAAPWVVFGGGAAALVTGGILMGVGASSASAVTAAPDGSRWADLESKASGANTMWGLGIALAGVGLAGAVVGLVWGLSGSRAPSEATARLRIGPTGAALEGEF